VVTSIAERERAALADLLDEVGPDRPTLCEGWSTRDLAAHLAVRERRPDATPGVAVKALSGWTESVQASYAERDYAELVDLVRTGPGRLSPFALPGMDKFFNTTEYVVHHEDVRRAQPGWTPRDLPRNVQDALWRVVRTRAPFAFRSTGAGVVLRRSDAPRSALTASKGEPVATVTGEPLELLLYAFGRRDHARVEVTGDPTAVAALQATSLDV
jgi:uncharacterized protein (TIGR03085 family)